MDTERKTSAWFREQAAAGNFNKKGRLVVPTTKGKKADEPKTDHKYGADMGTDDVTGRKISALEKKHAKEYRMMLREGLIAVYAPQAEISLTSPRTGGKHKYICDHLIIHWDGTQEYIDSKGFETSEYKKKANWMERQFLPRNPLAIFKARKAKETHTYVAKPPKGMK